MSDTERTRIDIKNHFNLMRVHLNKLDSVEDEAVRKNLAADIAQQANNFKAQADATFRQIKICTTTKQI